MHFSFLECSRVALSYKCKIFVWAKSKDVFDCEPFDVDPAPESAFCEPMKAATPVCGSGYGYTPSWGCANGRNCGKNMFF